MSDVEVLDRFLYEHLSDIAPTHNGPPPNRMAYPLIEFNLVSFSDLSVQSDRQGFTAEYRIVGRTLSGEFPYDLQLEIDTNLHSTTDVIDGLLIRSERLKSVTHLTSVAQTPVREAGGHYQLFVSLLREAT